MDNGINKKILIILGFLVIISSFCGIFLPNFYSFRNNSITTYEITGQDLISLIVGLLLIVISLTKVKYKLVVIIGLLIYILYTYLYFTFGLIFSNIFVIYLAIVSLSFFCLINTLLSIFTSSNHHTNVSVKRGISIYIFIIVIIVGIIDLKDILIKTVFSNNGFDSKSVFYVLDLAFLFPSMIYAAIRNYQKKYFGNILIGAFLVKTITLMPALIISDTLHYLFLGSFVDFSFDIIAFCIMLSAVVMFIVFFHEEERLTTAST
jgi:hypothetical protein